MGVMARHTFRVRVDLEDARPPIWRQLELASDLPLDDLHLVLQAAFSWGGHHLHQFSAFGRRWEPGSRAYVTQFDRDDGAEGDLETGVRIDRLLATPGDRLYYWYDFGDDWNHVITLQAVLDQDPAAPAAQLSGGRRAAPPDDCGGVHGYEQLIKVLADPTDNRYAEFSAWLTSVTGVPAAEFDPAEVDLAALDRDVRAAVTRQARRPSK